MDNAEYQRLIEYVNAARGMKIARDGQHASKRSVKHGTHNIAPKGRLVVYQTTGWNDSRSSIYHYR